MVAQTWNISSATASDGATRRKRSGTRWGRKRDREQSDAHTCKSLSCSPWRSAIKR